MDWSACGWVPRPGLTPCIRLTSERRVLITIRRPGPVTHSTPARRIRPGRSGHCVEPPCRDSPADCHQQDPQGTQCRSSGGVSGHRGFVVASIRARAGLFQASSWRGRGTATQGSGRFGAPDDRTGPERAPGPAPGTRYQDAPGSSGASADLGSPRAPDACGCVHDPGALLLVTPVGSPVRIANWRHRVWQPAANAIGLTAWATPYVLRHTAASLMTQRGVPVSAAAAALGHDPATFLRTYAHLYPGDLRAVADAMDVVRSEVTTEPMSSAGDRSRAHALCRAGKTRGQIVRPRRARTEMAPDLLFRVGLPGFEPGTS